MENKAIYEAGGLGVPKFTVLGLQHLFAMFGATVLVPAITGLPVSATLLFAGIGTLLFHLLSKGKVPAFLGSSFAFLGGYLAVKEMGMEMGMSSTLALAYASIGIFCAGLCYFVLAAVIKAFGTKRVLKFFPPIVTGPIVIAIGLCLSGSAISSASTSWPVALTAIAVVIICNMWGKGLIKIVPILLGVAASYTLDALLGNVDFTPVKEAAWIGFPISADSTVFAVFRNPDWSFIASAIIIIMPISIATMMEHIGDMCAISSTIGKDLLADPGLHRTLMGDGLATSLAALFGAPANTTYGENTGVLNLTKVFDPRVIRLAALFAIILSISPKFSSLIALMPAATIGGVSLILYGMISAVGLRNIAEAGVDFTKMRNVVIAALILVIAIGVKYGANDAIPIGPVTISGLALAAIVGIILNLILPQEE